MVGGRGAKAEAGAAAAAARRRKRRIRSRGERPRFTQDGHIVIVSSWAVHVGQWVMHACARPSRNICLFVCVRIDG